MVSLQLPDNPSAGSGTHKRGGTRRSWSKNSANKEQLMIHTRSTLNLVLVW